MVASTQEQSYYSPAEQENIARPWQDTGNGVYLPPPTPPQTDYSISTSPNTSATDSNTLDELCAQGNFVDKWAEELDTLARNMTQGGEH